MSYLVFFGTRTKSPGITTIQYVQCETYCYMLPGTGSISFFQATPLARWSAHRSLQYGSTSSTLLLGVSNDRGISSNKQQKKQAHTSILQKSRGTFQNFSATALYSLTERQHLRRPRHASVVRDSQAPEKQNNSRIFKSIHRSQRKR